MIMFVLTAVLLSAVTSFALVPFVRRNAERWGLVDLPGDRKVHEIPTPMGGGIAIFAAVLLTVVVGAVLGWQADTEFLPLLAEALDELRQDSELQRQAAAVGVGAVALFCMGLIDDRRNLSWKLRLGIQLSVAVGVVVAGVRATVFVSQPWIGGIITIGWILVLTNALNFLDNMDGLSAGIGMIAAGVTALILLVLVREPAWLVAWFLLALAGALAGFLIWNRPPAVIFMGDAGSNCLGFLLATLTVMGTFYEHSGSRHVILAPLCILAIPLYDFSTVVWIRLREGRSPFHGDKSHFSHRLVELGLRPAHAVLTIHLATLMTGLGALLLYQVDGWTGAWLVIALVFSILSLIAILETAGRSTRRQTEKARGPAAADSVPGSGLKDAPRDD